ncbi:MAG: cytochrome c biogenesis heme-transporting ATPase CcmA [Halorhodospira sp.]
MDVRDSAPPAPSSPVGPEAGEALLEAERLTCRRGELELFAHVGFRLSEGELLFVRGRNGSGKTTLLRTLCGLSEPATGEVRWLGQPVRQLDEHARQQMLYLGHRDAVKEELTPLENLQIHQGLRNEHGHLEEQLEALEQAGLGGREDVPVRYLSQGQRRRTALARLLVSPATLWILDEPLTALDRRAVAWLFERIGEHLQRKGVVVTTSHQPIDGLPEPRTLDLD